MKFRITVLYVIGSLNRGGAETHLLNILPRLDKKQFFPEIFLLSKRGELADLMEQSGIIIHEPWVVSRENSSISRRIFRLFIVFIQLWFFLLVSRPRIIHFFLPEAYCVGSIAGLLAGIRLRIMSRRSRNHYQKKRMLIATIEPILHKTIHTALCNSKAVMDDLRHEGLPDKKIHLIYNGVDLAPYNIPYKRNTVRRAYGISEEEILLVNVANLIPYKGHEDLIKAMAVIHQEIHYPWRLLCVGRDGGIGEKLKNMSREYGLEQFIQFTGSKSNIAELLCAADIGILASHEEGFSNAVLEGMAAGLPMIVTDAGGNREAVIDGITGYVVPIKNPEALGEAIKKTILDPQRKILGRQGRKRVEDFFSIDICVSAYEKFYENLLDTNRKKMNCH